MLQARMRTHVVPNTIPEIYELSRTYDDGVTLPNHVLIRFTASPVVAWQRDQDGEWSSVGLNGVILRREQETADTGFLFGIRQLIYNDMITNDNGTRTTLGAYLSENAENAEDDEKIVYENHEGRMWHYQRDGTIQEILDKTPEGLRRSLEGVEPRETTGLRPGRRSYGAAGRCVRSHRNDF